jgi:Flp pilus assembly protein TadD/tRNA A-37 threonylcarbamoyl transferase component Bud32
MDQLDLIDRERRLDEVLGAFFEAIEAGQAAGVAELLASHPDLAPELETFFADEETVHRWTAPLRPVARAAFTNALAAALDPAAEQGTSAPGTETRSVGDYELLEEIGRGGMGVVYKARQKSLGRLVALKMIRAGTLAVAADVERLRNEAEIVAQLDHPHIVPIHEVGDHDGQPYFSMKLIEGASLAQHLARFQADARSAARLIFAVAQAVHHAHQRGILHRDLKPSNILLDAEGRPLVTDFGLARRVAADSSLTQSGALVGTPSYMTPEQASGKKGTITTATDVYGLGALLYALLTGRPPFRGETVLDILEQVKGREPEPPSQSNRRVDRDLETICLKCLAKEPPRRYSSAEAVAQDLERYLAGKPIQARPLGRLARLWRWCRRNPVLAGAAALLLAASLLFAGNLWRLERQAAATEQAVADDLREADLLQQQERWSETLQVLERASGRLAAGGPPPLRQRVEQRRTNVAMVARLEEARLQLRAAGPEEDDSTGADQAYAAAFASYGLNLETLAPEEAAERIRTSPIRTQLVAALDDWAIARRTIRKEGDTTWKVLLAVARAADPDAWRNDLRDALERRDQKGLERLAASGQVVELPPSSLVLLGRALQEKGAIKQAVAVLRQAQRHHPHQFWINFELAYNLYLSQQWEEAIRFYTAALAIRPQSALVRVALGAVLPKKGAVDEAIAVCNEAIRLKPDYAYAYNNLGIALKNKGLQHKEALDEAVAAYKEAIRLKPKFAEAYDNLGVVLGHKGAWKEALDAHRKAIDLKRGDAEAYGNLGHTLVRKGDLDDAITAFREAIRLKPKFAGFHNDLGVALTRKNALDAAFAALKEAIRLDPRFAQAFRNLGVVLYRKGASAEGIVALKKAILLEPNFADAYYNLGRVFQDKGVLDEAITAYEQTIRIQADYAEAHCNLGHAYLKQGRFADGLTALRRGHELGSQRPGWPYRSDQWVSQAEQQVARADKLAKVLSGESQPAGAAEGLALAQMCQRSMKLHAAAAHFFAGAFAAQPGLADDPRAGHRYDAACAAALAGSGQGKDAEHLDAEERARLRKQARDWLRADLTAWRNLLDKDKAAPVVGQIMQHWLDDTDFNGVRGAGALAKLPEAERGDWQRLWEEAAALRQRAQPKQK